MFCGRMPRQGGNNYSGWQWQQKKIASCKKPSTSSNKTEANIGLDKNANSDMHLSKFSCLVLVSLSFSLTVAFANKEERTTTTKSTSAAQEAFAAGAAAALVNVLLEERVVRRREGPNRRKELSSSSSSSSSSYEDPNDDDDEDANRLKSSFLSSAFQRTARRIIVQQQQQQVERQLSPQHQRRRFLIDPAHPIHILFPLPAREGRKTQNPFGITILKARPVVDESVMEVYRRQLLPPNSLVTHFNDSKTSDAHGPNVAINMLVENRVDCIIGYAFVYALAPVARMSPYWHDNDSSGIPVITSIGLTTNLDNREEYKLMTRISSPYKVVRDALFRLFLKMNWRKNAYMFHDERYNSPNSSVPHGECYLLMVSLQSRMGMLTRLEHNHFMFNELNHDDQKIRDNLKKASMLSNGGW